MRTLVDLGETQVQALDDLARKDKRSRAAVIREAIEEYLKKHRVNDQHDAFGLWGDRKMDGLAY
ncbi:CopG family transcriptional regulator [Skermanella stibiiresistens]|uniref:ribbon-helix-helix domain-containing protein n=1 Tax=Skermanella stibiiresistens TaxID=913326 RepID=UPI00055B14EB|nr:CopG family transcriptional regulator [Skermanella stibiiresistens]